MMLSSAIKNEQETSFCHKVHGRKSSDLWVGCHSGEVDGAYGELCHIMNVGDLMFADTGKGVVTAPHFFWQAE